MQIQRAEGSANSMDKGRFGYRNSFHGLKSLFKAEGVLGLFKGLGPRVLFGVLYSSLHLSLNDHVKFKLLRNFDK